MPPSVSVNVLINLEIRSPQLQRVAPQFNYGLTIPSGPHNTILLSGDLKVDEFEFPKAFLSIELPPRTPCCTYIYENGDECSSFITKTVALTRIGPLFCVLLLLHPNHFAAAAAAHPGAKRCRACASPSDYSTGRNCGSLFLMTSVLSTYSRASGIPPVPSITYALPL